MLNRFKNSINENKHFSEILRGGSLKLAGQMTAMAIGYVITYFVIKFFGAHTYGLMNIANSIITVALTVSLFGFQTLSLKLIPRYSKKYSKAFAHQVYQKMMHIVLIISFIIGLIAVSFQTSLETYLLKSDLTYIPYFIAALIIVRSLASMNGSFFRGSGIVKPLVLGAVLSKVSHLLVLSVLFFLNKKSTLDLFYSILISEIIVYVIFNSLVNKEIKKHKETVIENTDKVLTLLTHSYPMIISSISNILIKQTDKIMIGFYMNSIEVGVYSIAVRLSNLITFFLTSLNTYTSPKISELYSSENFSELESLVKKNTKLLFWLTVPVCLVFLIFGKYLLLIFGETYLSAYTSLTLLSISQLFNACCGPVGGLLNMTKHQKTMSSVMGSASILNVILNAILIPIYGIDGAAIASFIAIIYWNVMASIYVKKHLNLVIFYIPFITK